LYPTRFFAGRILTDPGLPLGPLFHKEILVSRFPPLNRLGEMPLTVKVFFSSGPLSRLLICRQVKDSPELTSGAGVFRPRCFSLWIEVIVVLFFLSQAAAVRLGFSFRMRCIGRALSPSIATSAAKDWKDENCDAGAPMDRCSFLLVFFFFRLCRIPSPQRERIVRPRLSLFSSS